MQKLTDVSERLGKNDLGIAQRCYIRHDVCGYAQRIYRRSRHAGQHVPGSHRRPVVADVAPFLFTLVRPVRSGHGAFMVA